jgi:hypothetical protein
LSIKRDYLGGKGFSRNYIGNEWVEKNRYKYPSFNHIKEGIKMEAKFQLKIKSGIPDGNPLLTEA